MLASHQPILADLPLFGNLSTFFAQSFILSRKVAFLYNGLHGEKLVFTAEIAKCVESGLSRRRRDLR
ncbi:hypothetical protein CLDAP_23440 [Caldilinea aerophila DSM 14535 = NBRC 104270]|uniref:Uncharacterized protein n=1 Tax=Caldilinea aerophila (strain DSM 14535 / JCM 11387 / NBRC 104270 / STL-6-O1) TaxID=926550 RepID=I0I546_CALAS|nr:hypothetical protein CLDAP_23440 [Caldilinea aerophila DSM 14535 = NBRC 104270]